MFIIHCETEQVDKRGTGVGNSANFIFSFISWDNNFYCGKVNSFAEAVQGFMEAFEGFVWFVRNL